MRLRILSIPFIIGLCLLMLSCGGARLARRGDQQLAKGQYDDAIASYEAAARASSGEPAVRARYEVRVADARKRAAHVEIEQGDRSFRDKNLKAAGDKYRKARSYAPTDPLVVDRLSTLLKTRVQIESQLDEAWKTLERLQQEADKATTPQWQGLVSITQTLLDWRKDYPRVEALRRAVAAPASVVFTRAAQQALAKKDFTNARLLADKALRLAPNAPKVKALLDQIDRSGSASAHAVDAHSAMKQGRVGDALEAYHLALEQNPNSAAAKQGQRKARDAYVRAHLLEARRQRKARNRRGELLTLRDAWTVNTDDKKLAKTLKNQYDRAHKKAILYFYRAGRRHETGHRFGAALIAYRTAQTLGGGKKDLAKRMERCVKASARARRYVVGLQLKHLAKGVLPAAGPAVLTAMRNALVKAKLEGVGVVITEDTRAARKADADLTVVVSRFMLPRSGRAEWRKKKYLDRVEFPENPAWFEAQARQSVALAALNGTTDRLRPLQEEVNSLEIKLAKLDKSLIVLKKRIVREDATYYARQPKPCPDGSTNCPQSYANKRWAKHLTWQRDQVQKTDKKIAALSPDFSTAREAMAKAQADFDKAERDARETPNKLRKEIWKDHAYTVRMHAVELKGTVQVRWQDRLAKAEMAGEEAKIDTQKVDFSTPGVVIRTQTLEPPRKSSVPDDAQLVVDMAEKLVTAVVPNIWVKMRLHGERFALRAKRERRPAMRLDLQTQALATGRALSAASRAQFLIEVMKATGYDWQTMNVDLRSVPYR